jgi:VanZ family protein
MSVLGSTWERVSTWYRECRPLCRWIPVVVWMALIFALSAQPHLPSPPSPFWSKVLEKGGHTLEYAVLGALIWPALGGRMPMLAWVLAVAYAVSDEYHQSFVPGRHPDAMDALFDATGAALAVLLLWWGTFRRRRARVERRRDGAR